MMSLVKETFQHNILVEMSTAEEVSLVCVCGDL